MATREWHFADIDVDQPDLDAACFGHPVTPVPFPEEPKDCVVDKISQFKAQFADPAASHDDKAIALEFLLHFVGDVHQPLHAAQHQNDRGGNAVTISYESASGSKKSNLHSYWDTVTVGRLGRSADEIAAKLIADVPKSPRCAWAITDPAQWAMASFQLAKRVVYKLPVAKGGQPVKLSSSYAKRATTTARKQLALAGYRLAMLLNQALSAPFP